MKINGDASLHPLYRDSSKIDPAADAPSGAGKSGSPVEIRKGVSIPSAGSVSMSDSVATLSKSIKEQPSIRVDLVNELKAKIANGTYKPSPDLIASAMVDSAFDDISLGTR